MTMCLLKSVLRLSSLLAFLLFMSHCGGPSRRACKDDLDCQSSAPAVFCLEGYCDPKACQPNLTQSCFESTTGSPFQGICHPGVKLCNQEGKWSSCLGQILPQREICDGFDNNCNGLIDEKLDCFCSKQGASRACFSGPLALVNKGLCKQGLQYCQKNNLWGRCFAQVLPVKEICDTKDNNCDGQIDEKIDCSCEDGQTRACYIGPQGTQGRGPCKTGTQSCTPSGQWGECKGQLLPKIEQCNNQDDDCDGIIDGTHLNCASGEACIQGKCGCPAKCDGSTCTDLQSDVRHCGKCANACPTGALCVSGECRCPSNRTERCPALIDKKQLICVDLQSDPLYCGACDNLCRPGFSCDKGQCVCPPSKTRCGSPPQCTDLQSDLNHCGQCDNVCARGARCEQGKCVCPANQKICGGQCVPHQNDPLHCGTCNNACKATEFCDQGTCRFCRAPATTCGASCCPNTGPTTCCNGTCADLKNSADHCGTCNAACTPGQRCCNGFCGNGQCLPNKGIVLAHSLKNFNVLHVTVHPTNQNTYVTGFFEGALTLNTTPNPTKISSTTKTFADMLIIKYDPQGRLLWARQAGGGDFDVSFSILLDANENLYVGGTYKNSNAAGFLAVKDFAGNTLPKSTSLSSYAFIAKLDKTGKQLWFQTAITTNGLSGSLALGPKSGDLYVTGQIEGSVELGGKKQTAKTTQSTMFVTRLNPNTGLASWLTLPLDNANSSGNEIAMDANENIYIVGHIKGSGTFAGTSLSATSQELLLLSFEPSGKPRWAVQTYQSLSDNSTQGISIAVDQRPNTDALYLIGEHLLSFALEKTGTPRLTTKGDRDGFMLKFTTSGKRLWAIQLSNPLNLAVGRIRLDSKGQPMVSGFNKHLPEANDITHAFFIRQYDTAGKELWKQELLGGKRLDLVSICDFALDAKDNVTLSFAFSFTLSFENISFFHPEPGLPPNMAIFRFPAGY